MKKILSFLLCLCFIVSLTACSGKPEGMSQEMYDYGCRALKLTDDFFDEKISLEDLLYKSETLANEVYTYEKIHQNEIKENKPSWILLELVCQSAIEYTTSLISDPTYVEFAMQRHIRYRNKLANILGREERVFDEDKILIYINEQLN